jgi:hypothetical protein
LREGDADYLEIGCGNKLMTAVTARSEIREGMNSQEEEDKMRQSTIDVHKVKTIPWIDTGVRIRSDQIRYQQPSYCITPVNAVISFLALTLYYNRPTSNPYASPNPNIYASTKIMSYSNVLP